ncbi:MAG: glycosyltransferase family 4 protein [Pirellulales bacterium]
MTIGAKRILFAFASHEFGGAERQILNLAQHLKDRNCSVHIWNCLPGPGAVTEVWNAANIPVSSQHFIWPCRKSSFVVNGIKFARALRKLAPDIILPYTTFPNVACGLFWRFSPARVCIWSQRNVNCLTGDRVERFAYQQSSAVVCNASHEVDYLRNTLGPASPPTYVVHNGVHLPPVRVARQQWRAQHRIPADAVVFTMAANFREQKDHLALLRGWLEAQKGFSRYEPQPVLVLAGAPQTTYAAVESFISEHQLAGSVRILQRVLHISDLLAASDVGILISHYEGLSNSIVEYMLAGLPVIASDLPGNREALGDDLLQPPVPQRSPFAIARLLQEYSRNEGLRIQLGLRNRERAESLFSFNAMCIKTVSVIEDVYCSHRRRRFL